MTAEVREFPRSHNRGTGNMKRALEIVAEWREANPDVEMRTVSEIDLVARIAALLPGAEAPLVPSQ